MSFVRPDVLNEQSLQALLAAPPEDYDSCNHLSRWLHNLLTPKRHHLLQVTPEDLLAVLECVPCEEQRDIHRILKMFLAMYVLFLNSKTIFARSSSPLASPTPESLAAAGQTAAGWGGLKGGLWRRLKGAEAAPPVSDMGAVSQLARSFLKEEERLGETPHLAFLRGALAYKSGDIETGFAAFDRARQMFVGGQPAYHHQLGAHSIRPLAEFDAAWARGRELSGDFTFERDTGFAEDLPILVIGVDQGYYDRYAARWISVAEGRANLHFHVANPDQSRLAQPAHVRYSFETRPGASSAYYASMRFLHLHRMLEHYQKPLIVSDADAQLVGNPRKLLKQTTQYDLAFTVPGGYRDCLPWRHLIAQALMARPTEGSARFLACFRALFADLEAQGGVTWWVDQALLSASLALLRARNEAPAVLCDRILSAAGLQQGKL